MLHSNDDSSRVLTARDAWLQRAVSSLLAMSIPLGIVRSRDIERCAMVFCGVTTIRARWSWIKRSMLQVELDAHTTMQQEMVP